MKTFPFFVLLTLPALAIAAPPAAPAPSPSPAAASPAVPPPPEQAVKLAAAIKIGREWQNFVLKGQVTEGMALWGYSAFNQTPKDDFKNALGSLGALKSSELEEDRCLVDLKGNAAGSPGEGKDTYITLRWFSEYEQGFRRESIVVHEPAENSNGLKIIGLRREELPVGRQGGFELAANLGQMTLLKFHGAPRARWQAYEHEARAYASLLKATLPAVPESPGGTDKDAPEKLVNFLMLDLTPVFDKLGGEGGAGEAKMVLNAFAMLMMYVPGEETGTRLAALVAAEAEKTKLPPALWKPLLQATVKKESVPAIQEAVQTLVAGVSGYLGNKSVTAEVKNGTREALEMAFKNMTRIPSYVVHAELTAPDSRKSFMDATLGPGMMDLTLVGFDGRSQRHVVTEKGFFLSTDSGTTWSQNPDQETATGLCRTLQAPVDTGNKITEKFTFELATKELVDGEELYRFRGTSTGQEAPRTYWLLVSKAGPVIRRVRLAMTFGTLTADTLIIYSKLGKKVEIKAPPVTGN